jgi:hypothetical protein
MKRKLGCDPYLNLAAAVWSAVMRLSDSDLIED